MPSNDIELRVVLEALSRNRKRMARVFAAVSMLTVAILFALPTRYSATTLLLVDNPASPTTRTQLAPPRRPQFRPLGSKPK